MLPAAGVEKRRFKERERDQIQIFRRRPSVENAHYEIEIERDRWLERSRMPSLYALRTAIYSTRNYT